MITLFKVGRVKRGRFHDNIKIKLLMIDIKIKTIFDALRFLGTAVVYNFGQLV